MVGLLLQMPSYPSTGTRRHCSAAWSSRYSSGWWSPLAVPRAWTSSDCPASWRPYSCCHYYCQIRVQWPLHCIPHWRAGRSAWHHRQILHRQNWDHPDRSWKRECRASSCHLFWVLVEGNGLNRELTRMIGALRYLQTCHASKHPHLGGYFKV